MASAHQSARTPLRLLRRNPGRAEHVRFADVVARFVRGVAGAGLAALVEDAGLRAFFLQSLDLKAEGGPRWRLNFDVLEAEKRPVMADADSRGSVREVASVEVRSEPGVRHRILFDPGHGLEERLMREQFA